MAVSKISRWKLDMHVGPKFLLPPMIYNLSWTPKVWGIIVPSLQVLVWSKLLNILALSWYIVSFEICIPACVTKRRVLNLNKHPAAYWIYTLSTVLGVLTTLLIFPS